MPEDRFEPSADDEPPSHSAGRIAVVYNTDFLPGGSSADAALGREAGEETADVAARIVRLLAERGLDPVLLGVDDNLEPLMAEIAAGDVGLVVNLVESLGGDGRREPEFPALLDKARVPYTGNRPHALLNAQGKHVARRLMAAAGVRLPAGVVCEGPRDARRASALGFPLFVKPACADGSIGVDQGALVHDTPALQARLAWLAERVDGPLLVERYLPGRELNVAIFPNPASGRAVVTGIDFSSYPPGYAPIVTYDCKWTPDCAESNACSRLVTPDVLGHALYDDVVGQARAAFRAIGGDAYGRVDLRLDGDGRPRVIDVNPNPDLHPEAGFTLAAGHAGVGWEALILSLVADAHPATLEARGAHGARHEETPSWSTTSVP